MRRHFTIWCANGYITCLFLFTSALFADPDVFTGKLVRKHYQLLIPRAVEQGVFGWFLELDSFSKVRLQEKIAVLSEEDRRCCVELGFDLSIVQLFLPGIEDRQLCRHFEGKQVKVLGEWPSSPHMFRPIPSYQLHLIDIKEFSADVVELSGLLTCKIFPGPPNYDSVEDGDYPEVGWILKLDDRSKDRLTSLTPDEDAVDDEIAVEVERQYESVLQQYTNRNVICLGSLHPAENAHHPTPFLLRSCQLIAIPPTSQEMTSIIKVKKSLSYE